MPRRCRRGCDREQKERSAGAVEHTWVDEADQSGVDERGQHTHGHVEKTSTFTQTTIANADCEDDSELEQDGQDSEAEKEGSQAEQERARSRKAGLDLSDSQD